MKKKAFTYLIVLAIGIFAGLLLGLTIAGSSDVLQSESLEGTMTERKTKDRESLALLQQLRSSPNLIEPFHEYLYARVANVEPDPQVQAQIERLLSQFSVPLASGRDNSCSWPCHGLD
jgi:hypothetical protein